MQRCLRIASVRLNDASFSNILGGNPSKINNMNTPKLLTIAVISAGLAFGATAQAGGKKHHEEQDISSSDVPAAVQQAADKEASGGKIVRWEKEGANY